MEQKKDKLIKANYTTSMNRILYGEVLKYCIEYKVTLPSLIEDALCEKIGIRKEQLIEKEKDIANTIKAIPSLWIDLLAKQDELKNKYTDIVKQIKGGKQTMGDINFKSIGSKNIKSGSIRLNRDEVYDLCEILKTGKVDIDYQKRKTMLEKMQKVMEAGYSLLEDKKPY